MALELPQDPMQVFDVLLANKQRVRILVRSIKAALYWLKQNNILYYNIFIAQSRFLAISSIELQMNAQCPSVHPKPPISAAELLCAQNEQLLRGSHASADGEAVLNYLLTSTVGV